MNAVSMYIYIYYHLFDVDEKIRAKNYILDIKVNVPQQEDRNM
jgi:hypothetical protein